jgi:hypothetical protein
LQAEYLFDRNKDTQTNRVGKTAHDPNESMATAVNLASHPVEPDCHGRGLSEPGSKWEGTTRSANVRVQCAWILLVSIGALFSNSGKLEDFVFRRSQENAGAAALAPNSVIDGPRLATDVVAGIKRLLVDPELAMKQMQFLGPRVAVRRIIGSRSKAHEHARPAPLMVHCKDLDKYARSDFLPFVFRSRR